MLICEQNNHNNHKLVENKYFEKEIFKNNVCLQKIPNTLPMSINMNEK